VTLALAAGLSAAAPAAAADLLRLPAAPNRAAGPVTLAADDLATWPDGRLRVIRLAGSTRIDEAGGRQVRAAAAVVWVEPDPIVPGRNRLAVYAEGDVRVEGGDLKPLHSDQALVEVVCAGEPELRGRPVERDESGQPLYRAALAARVGDPQPPAGGVVPAGLGVPPGLGPDGTVAPPPAPPLPTEPPRSLRAPYDLPPPPPGPPLPTPPRPAPAGPPVPVPPPGVPEPPAPARPFRITPRGNGEGYNIRSQVVGGETVVVVTGGVMILIAGGPAGGLLDIAADNAVIWKRGDSSDLVQTVSKGQGSNGRELEFYLTGNVVIRSDRREPYPDDPVTPGKEVERYRLDAESVYYDVKHDAAVAVRGDLEISRPPVPGQPYQLDPFHFRGDELLKLNQQEYRAVRAELFSTKLPSDPGLKLYIVDAELDLVPTVRRGFFGNSVINRETGQPREMTEKLVRGKHMFVEAEHVPVFYLPFYKGNAEEPLGPLINFGFKEDRIFGTQLYATFNAYSLFGIDPVPNTRWLADLDYLSARGPAAGTTFEYGQPPGAPLMMFGQLRAYGIHDTGPDQLGPTRGDETDHPAFRGRLYQQHYQEFKDGFTVMTQVSILSDKNFLEQFYKFDVDLLPNQESFLYLKKQEGSYAATVLVQPNAGRNWATQDLWLPRVDGQVIGQSVFDLFTYNARASAGYGILRPTTDPPPPIQATDQRDSTGRFDLRQELALPFNLGPFRVQPYGVVELTEYTQDLTGSSRGRFYGGGGVRASVPLSRLYPDVQSEYLNVKGVYHKMLFSANYFGAYSDTPYTRLPQLDRLNDDATDQAMRDITPQQTLFNTQYGAILATSPVFDPQRYAIRRLVDSRIDTLDSIQELQLDLRQRWQTKRGYPGMEHVIDWIVVDLSASFFPDPERDNFGSNVAFIEYDSIWNIGDRTALTSTGWFDPFDAAAKNFTIGAFLNRPDRTSFYLGYRHTDPINSRTVILSVSYIFSPKYAITATSVYDFGFNQAQSNSLALTRMGTDVQVSASLTYNAILNNFGFNLEVVPNLFALGNRVLPGQSGVGTFGPRAAPGGR
jgi:hypothetical protein